MLGEGGDGVVYEAFLENGTGVVDDDAPEGASTKASGQFTITAASGVANLAIAGESWGIDDLNGATESVPLTASTSNGVLSITGFENNGDGTYTVDYTYELTAPTDHPDEGRDELQKDAINVMVTDGANRTAEDTIDMTVVDDVPVIESIQNLAMAVTHTGVVEGAFVFDAGADGLAQIGLTGDAPDGFVYDTYTAGDEVPEGINAPDLHGHDILLVARTDDADEDIFFTFLVREDGNYEFEIVDPFAGQSFQADFAEDVPRGNGDFLSFSEGEGWTFSSDEPASKQDVTISGNGDINTSGQGMGVGGNNFRTHQGESDVINFDFAESQASFTVGGSRSEGTVSWKAFEKDDQGGLIQVGADEHDFADGDLEVSLENGMTFDRIEITAGDTGSNFLLKDFSFASVVDLDGKELDFEFSVKDGDGDTASESVQVSLLTEEAGDYEFTGTNANDVLVGTDGDDILIGGGGDDILTGGAGNDVFLWNSGDEGSVDEPANDVVTDFGNGDNVLDVSDLLDGASESNVADFIIAEEDGDDTVLYISSEGELGGHTDNADQTIRLEGKSFSDLGGSNA